MAVQVTISDLTNKVNEGWKKPQLAEHYGLPMTQVTKLLQTAGLKIRKFHLPKFELVDDTQEPGIPMESIEEISTRSNEDSVDSYAGYEIPQEAIDAFDVNEAEALVTSETPEAGTW